MIKAIRAASHRHSVFLSAPNSAATFASMAVRKVERDRGSAEDQRTSRRFDEAHAMALKHPMPPVTADEFARMLIGDDTDQDEA